MTESSSNSWLTFLLILILIAVIGYLVLQISGIKIPRLQRSTQQFHPFNSSQQGPGSYSPKGSYCPACGGQIPPKAGFCPHCGNRRDTLNEQSF